MVITHNVFFAFTREYWDWRLISLLIFYLFIIIFDDVLLSTFRRHYWRCLSLLFYWIISRTLLIIFFFWCFFILLFVLLSWLWFFLKLWFFVIGCYLSGCIFFCCVKIKLLQQAIRKVSIFVFHVNSKLMQVVFKMHQVVLESIIFSLLCLYTLSDTVTQLLQSPFNPNGPPCSYYSNMLWYCCSRFTSNSFYSTSSESSFILNAFILCNYVHSRYKT